MTDTHKVEGQALALVDQAEALTISNDAEFEDASLFLRETCKAMRKQIADTFDPMEKKAYSAWKEIKAQRKTIEDPVIKAEAHTKKLIGAYVRHKEQEQKEREAEARRLAQERAEREQLERAAALEDAGRLEEAEAILESQPVHVAVFSPDETPRAEGVSVRKVWKFRVVDATRIAPAFLTPDEKKIGQIVRSMKEQSPWIVGDGIEVYSEDVVAARL